VTVPSPRFVSATGASPISEVGDLAEIRQDLAQLRRSACTEVDGPFRLDVGHDTRGGLDGAASPLGDLYEFCAGISRIGRPHDITRPFESVYEKAGGLLRDLRGDRKIGDPRAFRVQSLEHSRLSKRQIVEAVLPKDFEDAILERPVRNEQQQT